MTLPATLISFLDHQVTKNTKILSLNLRDFLFITAVFLMFYPDSGVNSQDFLFVTQQRININFFNLGGKTQ